MELADFEWVLQQCASEVDWPVEVAGEAILLTVWGVQTGMVLSEDFVEGVAVVDWLGFFARVVRLAQLCEECGQQGWAERLRQVAREAMRQHVELAGEIGRLHQRVGQRRRAWEN
jgi:hypothetical protein